MSSPLFAAIEAGGTKFNIAVGYHGHALLKQATFATTGPEHTLQQCQAFLNASADTYGAISALAIAGFGPLGVNPESPAYGRLLRTPKPGWSGVDLLGAFRYLNCPLHVDTDVNCAALAEYRARELVNTNLAYITVGTGVGVGVCMQGQSLRGQIHPEFGHLHSVVSAGEPPGTCAFHDNCIEGLVCGPALTQRWSLSTREAPADHPLWDNAAGHIARLCHAVTLAYSPFHVVIGGGVMSNNTLLARIKKHFAQLAGHYFDAAAWPDGIDNYLGQPVYSDAGLVGAMLNAQRIFEGKS